MSEPYKICVIEKPFEPRTCVEHKHFIGHLLFLRMDGYSAVHGKEVVPIDPYDYFATNILLYKEIAGKIIPLACSRIIRYSDCVANSVDFPPLTLLDNDDNKNTVDEIIKLIEKKSEEGQDITFDSSFTVSPSFKCSSESNLIIKYIIGAVFHWHRENGENIFFASATLKVKTDRLFERLGLFPVSNDSSYLLHSINDEPALMMKYMDSPTLRTHKWMYDSREIWGNRLQPDRYCLVKEHCEHLY